MEGIAIDWLNGLGRRDHCRIINTQVCNMLIRSRNNSEDWPESFLTIYVTLFLIVYDVSRRRSR